MKESDRYIKLVEWSDEDRCYVGSCPEFCGSVCHGDNEAKVYKELCQIVDEWVEIYKEDGIPLPVPKLPYPKQEKEYSGKFVMRVGSALHKILAIRAYLAKESLNNYCLGILREQAAAYGTVSEPQPMKPILAAVRHEKYPLPRRKNAKNKFVNPA